MNSGQLWLWGFTEHSQVLFHSIFGAGCSMVSWLIVILINGWQWLDSCPNTGSIASPSPQPALLPSSSGTERDLSMKFSSHSNVYTRQPFPDPVNVLSVSWHTCSLNNDPGGKSCTKQRTLPIALEYFSRGEQTKNKNKHNFNGHADCNKIIKDKKVFHGPLFGVILLFCLTHIQCISVGLKLLHSSFS